MFLKKKKVIKSVEVVLISEKDDVEIKRRIYHMPENGTYKVSWAGGLKIYDAEKNLVKEVDFQAGFTKEFNFIYD